MQAVPCQLAHVKYSARLSRVEKDELDKKLASFFLWLDPNDFLKCIALNWYNIDPQELTSGAEFALHFSPINPFLRERLSVVLEPSPGFLDKFRSSMCFFITLVLSNKNYEYV